jgi:hypothetical protein
MYFRNYPKMSFLKKFVDHTKQDSFVNRLRQKRSCLLQREIERIITEKERHPDTGYRGRDSITGNISAGSMQTAPSIFLTLPSNTPRQDEPGFVHVTGNALQLPYEQERIRSGVFQFRYRACRQPP